MSKSQTKDIDTDYQIIDADISKINLDIKQKNNISQSKDGASPKSKIRVTLGFDNGDQLSDSKDESALSANTKEMFRNTNLDESGQKSVNKMAERLERKLIQNEFYKIYKPGSIWLIFFTIFLSNVFINIDHGSLPGCSIQIKGDLNMNDFQFGLLGSIVYGGLTCGAGVATGVYSKAKWAKPTLVATLLLNSIAIFLFTLSKSFYIDAGLRFLIGFFQVFSCIYMPVWADAFANEKQKSVWLTFLILSSPLGVVGGFTLTAVMVEIATWHYSFYIQGMLIVPCALAFFFTPQKYLDIDGTIKAKTRCAHQVQQKMYKRLNLQNTNFIIDPASITG